MNPKMTVQDAALCLGQSEACVHQILQEQSLFYSKTPNQYYFGHDTARKLFNISLSPKVLVFQIVKGGTGKTSLVLEVAIRASLYGARVLCIDMDQQGNLTQAFNRNADELPVMIDIIAEGYPIEEAIIPVLDGVFLLPSRFENAALDEALRLRNLPLDLVYKEKFEPQKALFDIILVDCPPSLGQSVAALALAGDRVISPVTPEKFAMNGLMVTLQSLEELKYAYQREIPLHIVLNKFDPKTLLSQETQRQVLSHPNLRHRLLGSTIRNSQEFPNSVAKSRSIFDTLKPTIAKDDIDGLTQELLSLSENEVEEGSEMGMAAAEKREYETEVS